MGRGNVQNVEAGGCGEVRWAAQLVVSAPLSWQLSRQLSRQPLMLLKTDCGRLVTSWLP